MTQQHKGILRFLVLFLHGLVCLLLLRWNSDWIMVLPIMASGAVVVIVCDHIEGRL